MDDVYICPDCGGISDSPDSLSLAQILEMTDDPVEIVDLIVNAEGVPICEHCGCTNLQPLFD